MTTQRETWEINIGPGYFDEILSGKQRVVFVPNTSQYRGIKRKDILTLYRQSQLTSFITAKVLEVIWESSFQSLVERCSKKGWLNPDQSISGLAQDLEELHASVTESFDGAYAISVQVSTSQTPRLPWSSENHGWLIWFAGSNFENNVSRVIGLARDKIDTEKINIAVRAETENVLLTGESVPCQELLVKIADAGLIELVVKNEEM